MPKSKPTARRSRRRASVNGSPASKDLRSPLAKARDKWLASEEGRKLCDHAILRDPSHKQYLINRIELAFLAGVAVAQKLKLENNTICDTGNKE